MKFTTLLLIVSMMQVSASSFAQRISLSKKNAPLIEVFNQIRLQSGYDFVFNASTLKSAKQVSIEVKNEELKVVLSKLFEGQPFEFSIEDKTVIVTRKEPSFLERIVDRFDNIDVRGRVVDSAGMALPGATVSVKGSKRGVTANANGEFYLQNVDDQAVLVISYTGYETREIKAEKDMGPVQASSKK